MASFIGSFVAEVTTEELKEGIKASSESVFIRLLPDDAPNWVL